MQHLDQYAKFNAVGMRLDLPGLCRQLLGRLRIDLGLALGRLEAHLDMWIGDGRLLQVLLDRLLALLILGLQFDLDLGAAGHLPLNFFVHQDARLVFLGVYLQLVVMGGTVPGGLGRDVHRLAGGELTVHARRRDANPLLAPRHLQAVKFGTVEQLGKDLGDLLLENAGAVVFDGDAKASLLIGGDNGHLDVRQDAGFFTGVQGIVYALFDGGQERLTRIIEAQQMAVLDEELGHRDIPLTQGHVLGGRQGNGL